MRTCHSCQRELDATATVNGKCPHCGAKLRKISQRTIDDTRLRDDKAPKELELIIDGSDESIDLETTAKNQKTTEANQGGATIELQNSSASISIAIHQPTLGRRSIASCCRQRTPARRSRPRRRRSPTGRI